MTPRPSPRLSVAREARRVCQGVRAQVACDSSAGSRRSSEPGKVSLRDRRSSSLGACGGLVSPIRLLLLPAASPALRLEPPIMIRASLVCLGLVVLVPGPSSPRPTPRSPGPNIPAPTPSGRTGPISTGPGNSASTRGTRAAGRLGETRCPGVTTARSSSPSPGRASSPASINRRAPRRSAGIADRSACPPSSPADHRVWLRFGAVDWHADVWVNGKKVGEHEGGYTPFEFDVTDAVKRDAENTLVVRAHDPTDPSLPTGKQIHWYTPSSGIWQTVWLEARPTRSHHDLPHHPRDRSGAGDVRGRSRRARERRGRAAFSAECPPLR